MQEHDQLERLTGMRRIATGLLVLMALLLIAVKLLEPAYPYLSFVGAFAEAAMVGGLADWFAVSALFRHPLGLPIPHTAIIQKNKDRIGEGIGNFLERNFMTHEVLSEEFASIDFTGTAGHWLAQPENSRAIAEQMAGAVPAFLRMIEDEDVGHLIRSTMANSLHDMKFAPLLAEVLSILIAGRQHHVLFERVLGFIAHALEQNKSYIRQKVHENSPGWMPKAIDEKFFERLIEGLHNILDEIRDEKSEWRQRFQTMLEELIHQLKTSPEYEEKLQEWVGQSLRHPLFRDYVDQVWQDIKQRLLTDAASPESQLVAKVNEAIRIFSQALLQDDAVRHKLNHWVREFAVEMIVERRETIAALIKRVIRKWDAETVSRKLELYVGKDLQYIRINGTLVGGLVGVILHALSFVL